MHRFNRHKKLRKLYLGTSKSHCSKFVISRQIIFKTGRKKVSLAQKYTDQDDSRFLVENHVDKMTMEQYLYNRKRKQICISSVNSIRS